MKNLHIFFLLCLTGSGLIAENTAAETAQGGNVTNDHKNDDETTSKVRNDIHQTTVAIKDKSTQAPILGKEENKTMIATIIPPDDLSKNVPETPKIINVAKENNNTQGPNTTLAAEDKTTKAANIIIAVTEATNTEASSKTTEKEENNNINKDENLTASSKTTEKEGSKKPTTVLDDQLQGNKYIKSTGSSKTTAVTKATNLTTPSKTTEEKAKTTATVPVDQSGDQNLANQPQENNITPEAESPSSGHFMGYLLTAIVLCVAGYVVFHNKQKIIAFIVEGRSGRQRRRTGNGVEYKKLSSNVEEVMPSLDKSAATKHFIY